MAVSVRLHQKAKTMQGIESWPYRAVADALEVIPRTLVQNAGGNAIRVLTELRVRKPFSFLNNSGFGCVVISRHPPTTRVPEVQSSVMAFVGFSRLRELSSRQRQTDILCGDKGPGRWRPCNLIRVWANMQSIKKTTTAYPLVPYLLFLDTCPSFLNVPFLTDAHNCIWVGEARERRALLGDQR